MKNQLTFVAREVLAFVVFLSVLMVLAVAPAFSQEAAASSFADSASETEIGVKTGGYSTEDGVAPLREFKVSDKTLEAIQPIEAPKAVPALKTNKKKIGFWKKFHPDHIETYHPKMNKTWNGYMFVYEHGLKQSLDVCAKTAQIATAFLVN